MYLLGVLLVLGSLSQLINFISVRQVVKVPVFLYLISVLILAAGIVILFNPFTAATVPFIILGVSSIIYALNDLVRLLFYYHKRNKDITDVKIIEQRASISGDKISEYFVDLDISFSIDLNRKDTNDA